MLTLSRFTKAFLYLKTKTERKKKPKLTIASCSLSDTCDWTHRDVSINVTGTLLRHPGGTHAESSRSGQPLGLKSQFCLEWNWGAIAETEEPRVPSEQHPLRVTLCSGPGLPMCQKRQWHCQIASPGLGCQSSVLLKLEPGTVSQVDYQTVQYIRPRCLRGRNRENS